MSTFQNPKNSSNTQNTSKERDILNKGNKSGEKTTERDAQNKSKGGSSTPHKGTDTNKWGDK